MENLSSKLLDDAVNEFSKLPGIGKKTALRFVLHILKQSTEEINTFSNILGRLKSEIKNCIECHNISDTELCSICQDKTRDYSTICVVEDIRDVIAIENTLQYRGLYHVLGGIISPMDGIGPSDLSIENLVKRVKEKEVKEVIMALSTTMEGETTNFYIYKKLKDIPLKISTIARGISIGDELAYADEITLGRSILNRILYETNISSK